MQAQNDYVIVKRKENSKTTRGGLVIPETVTQPTHEFEVIAVGPKVTLSLKENDVVIINVAAAGATVLDGAPLFFVKEDGIVAVL